jgi:predicted SprT family Zn-dependent metalloprotease
VELLARYGLSDWTFAFNRRKTAMGLCLYGPRRIELAVYFVQRNSAEAIEETLRHEIAHALAGPGTGHGLKWKAKCRMVGANPERLSYSVDMPEGCWRAQCLGCGRLHHKHRRPKHRVGWYCTACGKERGRLLWEDTASSGPGCPG